MVLLCDTQSYLLFLLCITTVLSLNTYNYSSATPSTLPSPLRPAVKSIMKGTHRRRRSKRHRVKWSKSIRERECFIVEHLANCYIIIMLCQTMCKGQAYYSNALWLPLFVYLHVHVHTIFMFRILSFNRDGIVFCTQRSLNRH